MKKKVLVRTIFGLALLGTSLCPTPPAIAAYSNGPVWTNTATTKAPTAIAGQFPANLVPITNAMNAKWGNVSGSTLITGDAFLTSSVQAFDRAAFKISMQDTVTFYGETAPAFTIYAVRGNFASVVLNNQYLWSYKFIGTPPASYLGYVDSYTVILHELGHAYGLLHPEEDSNTPVTSAERIAVMTADGTVKRQPTSDDLKSVDGLRSIY